MYKLIKIFHMQQNFPSKYDDIIFYSIMVTYLLIDLLRKTFSYIQPPRQKNFMHEHIWHPRPVKKEKKDIRRKSPRNWFNIKFFNKICLPENWEKRKNGRQRAEGSSKKLYLFAERTSPAKIGAGSESGGEMRKRLSFRANN